MNIFGWIGSLLLSICSIPQAVQCFRQGHADGMNTSMIWLWGSGMLATFFYVAHQGDIPLMVNYGFNLVTVWAVIAWFKHFPRKK
jgi:uncharacterized protein with PQ loop repeat